MTIERAPLGAYVKVVGGFAFKSEDFSDEGTPVVRISDLQNGSIILDKVARIPDARIGKGDKYRVEPGDILVAMSGATTGKIGLAPREIDGLLQNQRVGNFKIINDSKVDKKYLRHFVTSPSYQAQIWRAMVGVAQPNISPAQLESFEFPIPPLAEQRRIAAVLDQAEMLRAKRRAALAQLYSLTQSLFLDLFGEPATNPKDWPKTTLGEIIEFVGGSQPPRETFTYEPSPDTIRLVQIRDFKSDEFKTYIPRKLARRFFNEDDVMIGRYGPPVFQILRGLSGSYNVALMKALPKGDVSKDFIFHLLQEHRLHSYVVARSERTAGQTGVNLELLEKYPAYLPPISLQREFARRVTAVEALKTAQRASLVELDALFGSLQHRAFNGKL